MSNADLIDWRAAPSLLDKGTERDGNKAIATTSGTPILPTIMIIWFWSSCNITVKLPRASKRGKKNTSVADVHHDFSLKMAGEVMSDEKSEVTL